MSGEHVELVRRGIADVQAFWGLLDEYVVWDLRSLPLPDLQGVVVGREAVIEASRRYWGTWDEYRLEAEELIPAGTSVVVVVRERGIGRGSGVPFDRRWAQIWSFSRGSIVRWELYPDREEALAAAGIEPEPTAKELVEELDRLFAATDFKSIRDALEGRVSQPEAEQLLGPFASFLHRAVDEEVVIDFTDVPAPADYTSQRFTGWRGWLDFWRLWFEPWDDQRSRTSVEEMDASRVIQHTITENRGRGSGAPVHWEGWNLWVARGGRVIRLEQYSTREDALAAAERHAE